MKKLFAILPLLLTIVVVYLLNKPMGATPALGALLDPMNGAWAVAEPTGKSFTQQLQLEGLQEQASVWFDGRMVPHVQAANDHDLFMIQGYTHAAFRLWQMDMQTRAAGGRVSEVLGDKGLEYDRTQRRKGMVYGAERSLAAMEADPKSKLVLDAYTEGVNTYIQALSYRTLPLEYKLMGFKPEPWTNLKCALLLKYMADDLTGYTEDIALTVLRNRLKTDSAMNAYKVFEHVFPERIAGSNTVIPSGTAFAPASLATPAAPADSLACVKLEATDFAEEENEGKGSNNWALSGSRTKSGAPILCNDPHLGLNLPSLWYEMQLHAPGINVYGVSLPGAPGITIGFNDNISWGFTNNYRDVKDFYTIKAASVNTYWFNGKETAYTVRVEKIKVKGKPDYIDTVRYTLHGPIMYEERFHGPGGLKKPVALCWMAHRASNEVLSVYALNKSTNYNEYVNAVQQFLCPAQNMLYADKQGNIALWGQGQFVNKWKGQGRYVMNGEDSSTLWGGLIPVAENPHALNPAQGYLASANQTVTDSTYPYWYNGYFYEFRSWRINKVLSAAHNATVQDMFALQGDVYSILAATVLPALLQYLPAPARNNIENEWLGYLNNWDYRLTADSKASTVFMVWWYYIHDKLGSMGKTPDHLHISPERLAQLITHYNNVAYQVDTAILHTTLQKAADSLAKLKDAKRLEWYHAKNTSVRHLTRLPAFSFTDLKMGGWGNTVNAAKGTHGPSWRMVVHMTKDIEAYGVYPGGQSGNPGSKYYADYLDKWVEGKYNKLSFVAAAAKANDSSIKHTWTIQPN